MAVPQGGKKIMKKPGNPVRTQGARTARLARTVLLLGCASLGAGLLASGAWAADSAKAGPWRPIFDGRSLEGWTPKIAGHPAGDNYRQTFMVKDGAIRVSYAGYERFDGEFGHLFYKTPFKAYRLRLSYRFLDPGVPGTPKWARSNSG